MTDTHKDHLRVPSMGEGVHEVSIIKWLKQVGEAVKKDEPLLEVSTDKVDTEIVAHAEGYLIAQHAKLGETLRVGAVLAQISSDAKTELVPLSSAPATAVQEVKTQQQQQQRPSPSPRQNFAAGKSLPQRELTASYAGALRASPLARKIAREHGIPLGAVQGTSLGGRISKDDLLRFMSENQSLPAAATARVETSRLKTQVGPDGKESLEGVPVRREKMTKIRQITAEHMTRSVQTSPHVTTTFEIDLSPVLAHKKNNERAFLAKHGTKLTFTPYFLYAAAQTLKEFPFINASVDGDEILLKDEINLACAMAIDSGLIVPVIRGADRLSLDELALALNSLVQRATDKKLSPADLQGGTFSVTNPGMFGSLHSQPIINQPQVAILSVGALVERPAYIAGSIQPRSFAQLGLTFDHRIIDGKDGALFLAGIKKILGSF